MIIRLARSITRQQRVYALDKAYSKKAQSVRSRAMRVDEALNLGWEPSSGTKRFNDLLDEVDILHERRRMNSMRKTQMGEYIRMKGGIGKIKEETALSKSLRKEGRISRPLIKNINFMLESTTKKW